MSRVDDIVNAETMSVEKWKEMAKEGINITVAVPTHGISMWPLLRNSGDSVRIVHPTRELVIGDIVMYHREDGKEIAHRICWLGDTMIETIGDNCTRPDKKFLRSEVVGLVTHTCRKGHLRHVDTKFWRFYGKFMIWSNPFRMFIRNKIYRPIKIRLRRIIKGNKKTGA